METNEKKPKRPRIGQNSETENNSESNRYEKVNPSFHNSFNGNQGGTEMNDNPRPYQRQYDNRSGFGGYNQNRDQNNYGGYHNRANNYRNRPYQQNRPYNNQFAEADKNGSETTQSGGEFQPRDNGYNGGGYKRQQNGFNPNYNRKNNYGDRNGNYRQNNYNRNQGGYNNRQGGYGNRQEGGYDNNRPYNNRNQGGYDNNRNQGGYNNRQGGYNNRQGGYNNRQGGFNNRRPGNFNNNRRPNGLQMHGKSFTPRPKRIEYDLPVPAPDEQIRLNKFLANAGLCSRREADEYIQSGKVLVNGVPATELGTKITHSDVVEYNGKVVTMESKCYILLNKPKDCVTTSDDPNGRLTVLDLVKGACNERIYPVGRLDRNTTGVLLLTNDGDLASKLTHPQYVKKKIYHVWTDKDVTEDDMQRIADGIELEDGEIHADAISYATETDRNQIGIEIHSGRNRIVRRIFESLGYHVTKLDRVYFAGLTKKNLPRGRWRYLTQQEVNFLKMGSFE